MISSENSDPVMLHKIESARIFLVDGSPIFRIGLTALLNGSAGFTVCGQAGSSGEALTALRQISCDAVISEISLPGANGLELLKQIRSEHPSLRVLIVSQCDEVTYALRSLRSGAAGYVSKSAPKERVVTALRSILRGNLSVSPVLEKQLLFKAIRSSPESSPLDVLSDRELEVLDWVGKGHTTKEIAERLHLSIKTVESHRLHIKEKLGFSHASELANFAVQRDAALQDSTDFSADFSVAALRRRSGEPTPSPDNCNAILPPREMVEFQNMHIDRYKTLARTRLS